MTEDFANYVSRIHRVNRGPALSTVAPVDEDTGFSTLAAAGSADAESAYPEGDDA